MQSLKCLIMSYACFLSPAPLVGTVEATNPIIGETSAGATTFIYAIYLVLYKTRAISEVITVDAKKIYTINFAKEDINFLYILCLVGPLMITLNIKKLINIIIKFATEDTKKFII
ncbi:hypothetical protein KPL25_04545 [Clostridium algidicarnis]|nr:hypothetical protein [Clostridium algidicarnis]